MSEASVRTETVRLDQLLVLIPALNEAAMIATVVSRLKSAGLTRVRVVDNGSTDATVRLARSAGAEVLSEPARGYGRACWRGLQDLPPEVEWILFCDGDGSDLIEEIPRFLAAAESSEFVLGNRAATAEGRTCMTGTQRFGNRLATSLISWGWKHDYADLGPMRLIRRCGLEAIAMEDRGFGWTVEMQVRAVEVGLRIAEIPVGYRRRQGGRSKVSGTIRGVLMAGIVILGTLGKFFLRKKPVQSAVGIASAALLFAGALLMMPYGNLEVAENVPRFLAGAAVMSAGFVASWIVRSISRVRFWAVAIGLRLVLLLMHPGDDIWRYMWEGLVQQHGVNPYLIAPEAATIAHLRTDWWGEMNHRDLAALYPPLAMLLFRAMAFVSCSVVFFKMFFIAADLALCLILVRRFGPLRSMLYAWNPLILYSIAGGGHYDSLFMLPLTAAWILLADGVQTRRHVSASLLIGASIAIKWVSAPLAAWMTWHAAKRGGPRHALRCALAMSLPTALSLAPFFSGLDLSRLLRHDFLRYGESASLLPYLVERLRPSLPDRNIVFLALIGVLALAALTRRASVARVFERYYFVLLVLSPVVHAWYFAWMIPFATATRNIGVRFAGITAFTYFWLKHTYATNPGSWVQSPLEKTLMWLPFVAGYAVSEVIRWSESPQSS